VKVDRILVNNSFSKLARTLFRASNGRLYSTSLGINPGEAFELGDATDFSVVGIPYVASGFYRDLEISRVSPDGTQVDRLLYSVFDPKAQVLHLEDFDGFQRITRRVEGRSEPISIYDLKVVARKASGAAILELERQYGVSFDDNLDVGERVQAAYGGGLFLGQVSRSLYWSPVHEEKGGLISASASLLNAKASVIQALSSQSSDLRLVSRAVALDQDDAWKDVQIAWPIDQVIRGQKSLKSLTLLDVNVESGRLQSRSVSKITDLLSYEKLFDADFNQDAIIGEKLLMTYGARLYQGAYGAALYWSPGVETVGTALSPRAVQLQAPARAIAALRSKPEDVSLVSRDVAVVDGQIEGVQAALPVYRMLNGQKRLLALDIYAIDLRQGKLSLQTISSISDILEFEKQFAFDFTADSVIGDVIETDLGGGLYVSRLAQSLYWSPALETVGGPMSALAVPLMAPGRLLSALQQARARGIVPASRLFAMDRDGVVNDLQIAVPAPAAAGGTSTSPGLTVYSLNWETGHWQTWKSADRADVRRYESLFQNDYDNDGMVGDPVTRDLGAGLYRLDSGSLGWSAKRELVGQPISQGVLPLKIHARSMQQLETAVDMLTGLELTSRGPLSRALALDRDQVVNDVQVVIPTYRKLNSGDARFASLLVYEINPDNADIAIKQLASSSAVNALEGAFAVDFNGDGLLAGRSDVVA